MNYKLSPLSYSVHLDTESPIFGESSVIVKVEDEAGGAFIILESLGESNDCRIDFDQFPLIMEAVKLIKEANNGF